jgi:phosphoglycolate phosphatase
MHACAIVRGQAKKVFIFFVIFSNVVLIRANFVENRSRMRKKLAIFDLDGTLLDTVADLAGATNYSLRTLGFPEHDKEEYRFLVGRGIYNLFRGALPEGEKSEENVQRMADLFVPYYNAHMCDMTRPYPGIPQMLSSLSKEGIALAVASNKYQAGTETLMKTFFPDTTFIAVCGQREGFPIKPDPAIVTGIMNLVEGITEEEVVYIGDSNVDMQTGKNAGVVTVGVSWGFRSVEELSAYSPFAIADTPEELGRIILG